MPTPSNPWLVIARWLSLGLAGVLLLQFLLLLWSMVFDKNLGDEFNGFGSADALPVMSLPEISEFQESIDRNIFSWNRKPKFNSGVQGPADISELAKKWKLIGLVNTPDSTYAIFSDANGEIQLRLEPGAELDGWQVDAVEATHATLVKGDEKEQFRLVVAEMPYVGLTADGAKKAEPSEKVSEKEKVVTEPKQ